MGVFGKICSATSEKFSIGPKTVDTLFIGKADNSSAYRFLEIKSYVPDIHVNTITESRNSSFFEDIFLCKDKQHPKCAREEIDVVTSINEASTSGTSAIKGEDVVDKTRRSKLARKGKSFGEDFMIIFLAENDPKSYAEAMYNNPDADFWKEAVNSEFDSILQSHTF